MICAIYKSSKQVGLYLYIAQRDNFNPVPEALMEAFGKPQFVMLFNLQGKKPLAQVDKDMVLDKIKQQGFYLQVTPKEENLLKTLLQSLGQTSE